MTVQQEAYALIDSMPDESVKFIIELINNMKPSFVSKPETAATVNTSNRIGIGKGIIEDPEDFDAWGDEMADLFEGSSR